MASVRLTHAAIIFFLCVFGPPSGSAQGAEPDGVSDFPREASGAPSLTVHASGSLRTDYFRSSRMVDGETDFYGATAQVKLVPVFSERIDGKVEARFIDPDIAQGRMASVASLQEGYVAIQMNRVDIRVGKQNVAWGRVDAANPTDNLTPRDYTLLLPFDEDQRFGATSIKLDAHATSEYTVILFMTPFFEPSEITLPLPPGAVVQKNQPAHTLRNSEVGLKVDKAGGETDWSVSYYHGFSLMPEILSSGLLFELRYPEMDVLGTDIARNCGRYGFRAEAAYFSTKDYSRREGTLFRPYLSYVIGVDRTFLESLNINMQILGNWVPNYRDPESIPDPAERSLAIGNAILFGQLHRTNYGLTFRIADRWFTETLEAEILLMAYCNPSNSYLRPLITYAFTDLIKGSVGAEIYSGTTDSYYGSIKSNQGFFAEFRFSF